MKIKVNKDKCTGCRLCRQVCAIDHFDEINPKKAALRIDALFPAPGKYRPYVCTQCGKCEKSCPEKAISRNEKGAYIVDKAKCVNCGTCVKTCPVQVIAQHPEVNHAIICDFCMKCTQMCNTGAIIPWESTPKSAVKEAANE